MVASAATSTDSCHHNGAAALLQVTLNIFQLDIQYHNLWQILIVFKGTAGYEWAFVNVHNINHCWIFNGLK